ncbi:MAG: MFS transporter [Actinomycetota bacterium]|nr:MFS transporter [Actinomycetota bacterium]
MFNLRPYPVYLGIKGAFAVFFMIWATVASVYRIEEVGLDPLRLVLLGTALEVAVLVFEVPTGVLADTYGRRRSVITGFLLMGSGFALEGAIPTFWAVLIAQAVWGVGYTFISGALEAWIADEAPEQDLGRVYLRGEQADYAGSLLGVILGVALATYALSLPLLVGGFLTIGLGVALFFAMPERNFNPSPREGRSSLQQVRATARGGFRLVRARPVLLILLVVAVFTGMSEEGFDRLYAKHFLDGLGLPAFGALDPVVWFGVISAGSLVLGYLAAEVLGRRMNVGDPAVVARLLLALNACTIMGMLSFALAGSFAFALAAFWFASLTRTLAEPLYLTWLNEGLEPGVRATVISMGSQAGAFGEASAGPVVGAVGNLAGVRAALTVASIILSPALLLYARAIRHRGRPDLEEAPDKRA